MFPKTSIQFDDKQLNILSKILIMFSKISILFGN